MNSFFIYLFIYSFRKENIYNDIELLSSSLNRRIFFFFIRFIRILVDSICHFFLYSLSLVMHPSLSFVIVIIVVTSSITTYIHTLSLSLSHYSFDWLTNRACCKKNLHDLIKSYMFSIYYVYLLILSIITLLTWYSNNFVIIVNIRHLETIHFYLQLIIN